jgi:hypothetical protein
MKLSKKEIQNRLQSRRQFLTSTGSTFLMLPPLLSIMTKEAAAQSAAQKKVRSVIYINTLGIDEHQIVPMTDPAGLVTHPGAVHTRYKDLNSFAGPFSRMIDSSFTSMYPHMNVFKGLSLCGGSYQGHNLTVLSGSHSGYREPIYGKSIDVIMEQSANVYKTGDNVKQKALRIGGNPGGHFSYDINNGNLLFSNYLQGDTAVFNQIFKGLTGAPVGVPLQQQTNSKLVVDKVYADLKALESNKRLSSEDRSILNRYISSIFDVQKKVQTSNAGTGPVCTPLTLPLDATTTGNGWYFPSDSYWQIQNTSVVFDNYIEMIRMAFLCDLTRVVVVQNNIWSDSPIDPNSQGGLHHECPSSEVSADRQQWGLKKMLKLATALQSSPDPQGGTLLDNSTVLYTNELGSWTAAHNTFAIPSVMFGRGGGLFKSGYFVDYSQRNMKDWPNPGYTPGRPYKQLLQSIMQSMGVTKAEYMQYGDGNGFGEFKEGINQFQKIRPDAFTAYRNEHNDLLPFITT